MIVDVRPDPSTKTLPNFACSPPPGRNSPRPTWPPIDALALAAATSSPTSAGSASCGDVSAPPICTAARSSRSCWPIRLLWPSVPPGPPWRAALRQYRGRLAGGGPATRSGTIGTEVT